MRNLGILVLLFFQANTFAQVIGGRAMFDFLNISSNAHQAALGGDNVSVYDRDPNLFLGNPALLNKKMDKVLSLSYLPYVADVKSFSLAGAIDAAKLGPFAIGFKYLDYGKMTERDIYANDLGTFSSKDYAFTLGKSYTIGTISLGANAKFLGSEIGSYNSYAWAIDAGALFKHPEKDFTIGLAVKNFGKTFRTYTETSKDSLPMNVQIGATFKPEHAPVRFSLTLHTLNKWDIVYNDPNYSTTVDEEGKPVFKKVKNAERLLRHLTAAIEIMPIKAFNLRVGYNYLMSKELSLTDGLSSAGLSFGASVRWDRYQAAYTHTIIHRSNGMNVLTVNVDIGSGYRVQN
jgi:hypothetical protein